MEKKSNTKTAGTVALLAAIIILQCAVCMAIGFNRQYMFTDEVYSYGLANSEEYSFLDPGTNTAILEWTGPEYFLNYLQYNEEFPFSFHAAFVNQANDVHPPLYYCLLHIVCFFMPGLGYSLIPGTVLNACLLPFIDILIFYIAKYFSKSNFAAFATVILWAFSSAGLSNAMFIRMYLLVTLWILALVAFHVHFAKQNEPKAKHAGFAYNTAQYIELILIIAAGGLTHYYFYFFAASFGLCVCAFLLLQRKYKLFLAYGSGLWLGVGLALVIFPAALKHIFGYRGEYATDNLGKIDFTKLKTYVSFIDESMFAGMTGIFIAAIIVTLIWRYIAKPAIKDIDWARDTVQIRFSIPRMQYRRDFAVSITVRLILFGMLTVALLAFLYVSIQGSEIVNTRYIYPAYPLLALFAVTIAYKCWRKMKYANIGIVICAVAFALFGVKVSGLDWAYSDFAAHATQVPSMYGKDCVIICRDGKWVNILQGINLYAKMDEVCCLYESNINEIQEILAKRQTKDDLFVAFYSDANYSEEEKTKILQEILDRTGMTNYDIIYDYYTVVYAVS